METRYYVMPNMDFFEDEEMISKYFNCDYHDRESYTIQDIADKVPLLKADLHATGVTVERTHNYEDSMITIGFFGEGNEKLSGLDLHPKSMLTEDTEELNKLLKEDTTLDKWVATEND